MAAHDLLTTAAPLMKRRYDDRAVLNAAFKKRPMFAWMPKKTGITGGSPFGGAYGGYQVPITIGNIPGESAAFFSAVTARAGFTAKVWQMNRVKRYATATIDWETVRAMKDDVGAFMRAIDPQIQSGIEQLSNSMQVHLYGDGSGHRGQFASAAANVITLTAGTAHLARTWSIGRTMIAATAGLAGTTRAGSTTVTGVDVAGGKIAVVSTAAITGLAANDFLFPLGDHATTTTPINLDGMASWGPVPSGITTGDSFKGVDRSVFKEKLLMLHYTVPLQSTPGDGSFARGLRQACAKLAANEGSGDVLFVHNDRWAQLESDLASQSRYETMVGSDGATGFDALVINGGGMHVKVVADPWCPPNTGYLLQTDTWEMFSIDRFPGFVSEDGNRLHRLENADEVEFRLGGYFNVACRAPGYNMVINFATS